MTQTWDPARYARSARFVSDLAAPVVELLAPRADERILDLGCGDGVLSTRLAVSGCAVVGLDATPAQVEAARARGVDARVGDATRLAFEREFDAVFSNAVLHWIPDADAVIAGVWRALRPGGRFVGEFGGHGNVRTVEAALREALAAIGVDSRPLQPWYYPTAEDYRRRLEAGGFAVRAITLIPRPTPLPGDIVDWVETFAQTFLEAAPPAQRTEFLAAVRDRLRPELCRPDGTWHADYVRLRFAADKPRSRPASPPTTD